MLQSITLSFSLPLHQWNLGIVKKSQRDMRDITERF